MLCGPGNNGGDGFVVARTLLQRGIDAPSSSSAASPTSAATRAINLEILGQLGLTLVEIADEQAWELHFSDVSACTLIVDAIFGTGLSRPLTGLFETVVADVNASGIAGRRDRSAQRPVGRHDRPDRPDCIEASTDRDARRAEAAARPAAAEARAATS